MSQWVMGNGSLMRVDELRISPDDLGFTHGDGIFETFLAVDGVPLHLDRHYARLVASAGELGLGVPGFESLRQWCDELLGAAQLGRGRARLRFTLSAGEAEGGFSRRQGGEQTLLTARALLDRVEDRPLRVGRSRVRRDPFALTSRHKTLSYGENLWALRQAQQQGDDEVLFGNVEGNLCEAACANVFVFWRGEWWTPALSAGCLPGVMRSVILETAKDRGVLIKEGDLPMSQLGEVEELLLSNSVQGLRSVGWLDGREQALEEGRGLRAKLIL